MSPAGHAGAVRRVEFFLDAGCPWTWATSRWLTEVADRQGVEIVWRSFDLTGLDPDRPVEAPWDAYVPMTKGFLRVLEAARATGRSDRIAEVYTALGTALHEDGRPAGVHLVHAALHGAGVPELAAAVEDTTWDAAVADSLAEARALAGTDIGSPVLAVTAPDGTRVGFFGPIVWPAPTGAQADLLWRAVTAATALPQLFELKRARTAGPVEHLPR